MSARTKVCQVGRCEVFPENSHELDLQAQVPDEVVEMLFALALSLIESESRYCLKEEYQPISYLFPHQIQRQHKRKTFQVLRKIR